ncbi:MAG TPA: hypothetical protein VK796_02890, partial [Cytophaga sp.]|nr:hypothetical protein [Cytophaga sp.]
MPKFTLLLQPKLFIKKVCREITSAAVLIRIIMISTLLPGLLLPKQKVFSQSFHTVSFSGSSSDFSSEPVSSGGNNVNYYIAYDASNLYIGAFRINSNTFGNQDNLQIFIDSDPNSTITSGTGTQTGNAFSSVTPTLPFTANYAIHIQNNGNIGSNTGYREFRDWTGTVWDGTANTGLTDYVSSTALEIAIPLSGSG